MAYGGVLVGGPVGRAVTRCDASELIRPVHECQADMQTPGTPNLSVAQHSTAQHSVRKHLSRRLKATMGVWCTSYVCSH